MHAVGELRVDGMCILSCVLPPGNGTFARFKWGRWKGREGKQRLLLARPQGNQCFESHLPDLANVA